MKLFTLKNSQWFPRTLEELFPFFADPRNLEQLTPPWLRFQMMSDVGKMRVGARFDYRLRLHGIPLSWQSEITVWDPPYRFVDVQTRGPYRSWTHEHTFEPVNGGTLMKDYVQYAVMGGALVRNLLVAPDLQRIFEFRRNHLNSLFGASR